MNTVSTAIEIPSPSVWQRSANWIAWAVVALLLAWSWAPAEMYNARSLVTDWRNMAEFASAFLSPDFHHWEVYASEMLVTVQIALWGTALAVVVGIPFAILSSANVAPIWVVQPMRRLMDAFRAINEIVFALFFVVAVGLGPFAGVMALFVHNTGIVAKLFSEAVEAIDPQRRDMVTAADTDGDGSVSRAELTASIKKRISSGGGR